MPKSLDSVTIAVTGAGGFLGPVVVEALAKRGARVVAIVGPPDQSFRSPPGATSIAQADICDLHSVQMLIGSSDMVVHLAGPPSVAESFRRATAYARIHVEGTAALLQACRAAAVQKLIYVSSAQVYGNPTRNPVPEDHPLSPRSPYAAVKLGAEKLVEAQAHAFGLKAVVLRPFSLYGPGASPESLIARIIQMAKSRVTVALQSLGAVRDYCFVDDFARSVVQACLLESAGFEVFNIGTMLGTSVEQVAEMTLDAMGIRIPVRESGSPLRPERCEIHELVADNRRARAILEWEPIVTLEKGLRITVGVGTKLSDAA